MPQEIQPLPKKPVRNCGFALGGSVYRLAFDIHYRASGLDFLAQSKTSRRVFGCKMCAPCAHLVERNSFRSTLVAAGGRIRKENDVMTRSVRCLPCFVHRIGRLGLLMLIGSMFAGVPAGAGGVDPLPLWALAETSVPVSAVGAGRPLADPHGAAERSAWPPSSHLGLDFPRRRPGGRVLERRDRRADCNAPGRAIPG